VINTVLFAESNAISNMMRTFKIDSTDVSRAIRYRVLVETDNSARAVSCIRAKLLSLGATSSKRMTKLYMKTKRLSGVHLKANFSERKIGSWTLMKAK